MFDNSSSRGKGSLLFSSCIIYANMKMILNVSICLLCVAVCVALVVAPALARRQVAALTESGKAE